MSKTNFNLAIETSSHCGSVTLGRGDEFLQTAQLIQPRRHNVDLMPAVEVLFDRHGARPGALGELHVSIGPGSFTGLRIAIATARMLAMAGGAKLVAVPTLDVVARNGPADAPHLAVCLNLKRDRFYAGLFDRREGSWHAAGEPALMTMAELQSAAPGPLTIIADKLPDGADQAVTGGVRLLPPQTAIPRSEVVWRLGRAAARRGEYTDAFDLMPLYVREPEAVELWNNRARSPIKNQKLMSLPKIVIIGRPNVGKSSLLNLLAGRRVSIVDPTAGVTRDRVSAPMKVPPTRLDETDTLEAELIDTGGYGIEGDPADDDLTASIERQIAHGVSEAHLILFVVDAQAGVLPLDRQVAHLLRTSAGRTPVLLVANKVDAKDHEAAALEAAELGFGMAVMVSAASGHRRSDLTEAIRDHIDWAAAQAEAPAGEDTGVAVAIVGKRNAGKSTLVNALAGAERVIVNEQAGTTRDAVDVRFAIGGKVFTAIDTAGVRKRKSLAGDVEFYSHHRALLSIRRADVVALLIDAAVPVSHVDKQLGMEILRHHKPCVIVVNKWDVAEQAHTQEQYVSYLDKALMGLDFAPVAFISAARGEGLRELVAMWLNLHQQASHRVSTGELNRHLEKMLAGSAPKSKSGKRARIYYAAQTDVCPPTVRLWVNHPEMFDGSYQRFLINRFRQVLPFSEVPIHLLVHGRVRDQMNTPRPSRRSRDAPAIHPERRPDTA